MQNFITTNKPRAAANRPNLKGVRTMKDLVIAVYYKDCYAGETVLKLEKVFYNEEVPEKYNTYEYEIKLMGLVEYISR